MSYSRRFDWGSPYLLTDIKDGVFKHEPAVFIGKKDADKERPTLCAVCGEPLGSKDYCSFFLLGPNGRGIDMMIGNGCIKERIREKEMGTKEANPRATLFKMVNKFPTSGRWYGTFLHHCIAKPYVRKKECAEHWDESILKLPGVQYIMDTIDNLRRDGWKLDSEMVLECGNVDLLATHPDGRAVVFDWKSDRSFDNHDAYVDQINRYMVELYAAGMQNIMGYIVWIMDKRLEPVRLIETSIGSYVNKNRAYVPSLPIKCSLTIEMDGGDGPRRKRITEYSHHRLYGDEVSFYIPPFEPYLADYDFKYFEVSPYREEECSQFFDMDDVAGGLHVSFICTKKRHAFKMIAHWKKHRPFRCMLCGRSKDNDVVCIYTDSKIDDDGNDYAEFAVSEINKHLRNKIISHAVLIEEATNEGRTEWGFDDLKDGMTIRIPCTGDRSRFMIEIETKSKQIEARNTKAKLDKIDIVSGNSKEESTLKREYTIDSQAMKTVSRINGEGPARYECNSYNMMSRYTKSVGSVDLAEFEFTPGRIYESGGKYYGVYRRIDSERYNTSGKVDVAEVDIDGRKISKLERRYVYLSPGGKEYIFALTNRKWKIYTKNVLVGLSLGVRI